MKRSHLSQDAAPRLTRLPWLSAVLPVLLAAGCADVPQSTFESPVEATRTLVAALQANDRAELDRLFGEDAEALVASGDPVADRLRREKFLRAYDEKHELVPGQAGGVTLLVGGNDWPLPIPIVKDDETGRWRFDTDAGKDEMLNRRIGQNELDVIEVCRAVVDAQKEYAARDPDGDGIAEYARKFISDAGTKNGLYWEVRPGAVPSPLGPLIAGAVEEGYTTTRSASAGPRPYHGYYYRMLPSQGPHAAGGARDYEVSGRLIGGFAAVAYPAVYGNSGIMTFIVNQDGVVYQRDLGATTETQAKAMTAFDPGSGWQKVAPAQDEGGRQTP